LSNTNNQQELNAFIEANINADVADLVLTGHTTINVAYAAEQIIARRKLKNKFERWSKDYGLIMPPPLSVEQASSFETAKFKSKIFHNDVIADLTGGFGIDSFFFAQKYKTVHYVEKNPELCSIARQNFNKLGLENIIVHNTSAEHYISTEGANIESFYLDPSRRSFNQKVFKIEDCEPRVDELLPIILKNDRCEVLIKTSPILDIASTLTVFNNVKQVYVVALKNECKEVLYFLKKEKETYSGPQVMCVNLLSVQPSFIFRLEEEKHAQLSYPAPGRYAFLYEPNAAILKSGAFKLLTERYHLHKAHPSTHLYFGNTLVKNFPGRIFKIKQVLTPHLKKFKRAFKNERANLSVRNFPLSVDQLKHKLKLKDGGDDYIFAFSTVPNDKVLTICEKLQN